MDWNVLEKWIILDGQTIYSKPQPNTQSIARIVVLPEHFV